MANSQTYIHALEPSSFYHITAVAHHISVVKIKTYFFFVMEKICFLIFFPRIFHSCKLNPRTSTTFLQRLKTHIISFNSSPVIERYFSELCNVHHVYITVHSNPFLLSSQSSLNLSTQIPVPVLQHSTTQVSKLTA